MSDPDRLTSHDDQTFGRDTRDLILRIVVVGFLTLIFWHMVIAAETPWTFRVVVRTSLVEPRVYAPARGASRHLKRRSIL
jgi:hypothetical protein